MNSQNRSLVVSIVLSALIMAGFEHFYEKPHEEAMRLAAAEKGEKGGADRQVEGSNADAPDAQVSALPEAAAVRPRAEVLAGPARVAIRNSRLYGSIPTTGIKLDDLTLADYYTTLDHSSHVDLLSPTGSESPYYATFSWVAQEPGTAVPDPETRWTVTSGDGPLTPRHPLTMSWDNGHGLVFGRTLSLDENYMFSVAQTVKNNSGEAVTLYPYTSLVRQGQPEATMRSGFEGASALLDGKLVDFSYGKLKDGKLDKADSSQVSTGGWLGFNDKYWLVAAIPDQSETVTTQFRHSLSGDNDLFETDYRAVGKTLAPGAALSETSHLFAGAKQVHLLTKYRDDLGIPGFEMAVDWGKMVGIPLWFLTKPFFYCIDFLAKTIGNFGLGILCFTVVMRILIFPLAWKTFREMNRMSDLAPKMNAIKLKYGSTNKEAMQAEVMELYQKEKVNPISGCLPMFLQIPIFFSLFKVLSTTIEMRQQPFFGYIHDLSVEDPTNIFTLFGLLPSDWNIDLFAMHLPPHVGLLPLLLGGTLLGLQMNGPKAADPVQQRIMMIYPVIFTFMMAHLPVGLVLYYILSNSISMGQQRFIRWFYKSRYRKEPQVALPTTPDQAAKEL